MGWKDKQWKIEVVKLVDGNNPFLFMDEGTEVESQYGEQVKFRVCPLDEKGEPGEVHHLFIGSAVLLEELKKIKSLTAKKIVINKTGVGADTRYSLTA